MTVIGVLFFSAIFISFFFPIRYTIAILLISTVFSASSVLNIAEKSIIPYLFCSVFVCLRVIFHKKGYVFTKRDIWISALLFVLYASLITMIGPFLFQGIEVVGSNLDESWWEGYDKLKFSVGNIAQIVYLLINVLTVSFLLSLSQGEISEDFLKKTFLLAIEVSLFFGFWEFLSKVIGAIPFPSSILLNSIGQGLDGELRTTEVLGAMRMSSLYSEASYFGAFLGAAFWALYYLPYSKRRFIDLILTTIALLLNMSGTGAVTFMGGACFYLMTNVTHVKSLLSTIASVLFLFFIISQIEYSEMFFSMLADKADSSSGQVRMGTTLKNLEIFVNSFFLGVGRGSTRSSSFIIDMLATVGIIGSALFAFFYIRLIKDKRQSMNNRYIFTYCVVLMIGQFFAIPDFSFSAMWFGLYSAACINRNSNQCYISTDAS